MEPSTKVCRNAAGMCDIAEQCTGSSVSCPFDTYQPSTTVCRVPAGICDIQEKCTGSSATCPNDQFKPSTTVCRSSVADCDETEMCTGNEASCPNDAYSPSTKVCRNAAGICDETEYCTGNIQDCPGDSFKPSNYICRESIGQCDPDESCTGDSTECGNDISGHFETECAGLDVTFNGQVYSWLNYDVISFHDFVSDIGDVEGRVAAKRDINVNHWSVGYELHTEATDKVLPYSLVAGRDLKFNEGEIYPAGHTGDKVPGFGAEQAFVGRTFTGSSYINPRVTGTCSPSGNGCLDSAFDAVQQCYDGYQSSIAAHSDNVEFDIVWSTMYINCTDSNSVNYYVSFTPSQLSSQSSMVLDHCNPSARWFINIRGTDHVEFTGAAFPAPAKQIVYNVLGSGRIMWVHDMGFKGSMIAPRNILNLSTGVMIGKTIVGNVVATNQINKQFCFTPSGPSTAPPPPSPPPSSSAPSSATPSSAAPSSATPSSATPPPAAATPPPAAAPTPSSAAPSSATPSSAAPSSATPSSATPPPAAAPQPDPQPSEDPSPAANPFAERNY
jgi:choice-of-anchor A domain-containing protein